jgi:beta-galactosidase/beta-glucuronidase
VVWYILDFDLPKKPDVGKVDDVISEELSFEGVDEEAWVWLNGQYIGQHCEGLNGWNRPFRFDIKREVRWGTKNRLVVRVSDTTLGGGIHKQVLVEVMK